MKIGIDLPVSGADASTGIPTQHGAELAIDDANAKAPSGFTFQAQALDDAVQGTHDPAQGGSNVRTFIADASVLAMIGPFNSNVAKVEIPLTNDAGLTQISPSNTSDELTHPPQALKLRGSHPNSIAYFRVCATDDRQGGADATFASQQGFKKVFIIDDNETYGKGLADQFESRAIATGIHVIGHEHVTKNQQDFKALLTKANALQPDAVFFGGTTSNGGGLVRKQMGDAGMGHVAFLGGDGISDAEFETVAGSAANGAFFSVAAPPGVPAFAASYKKKFSTAPGPYSANAYAAAQIEIAAIETAIKADGGKMPTREEVRANVASTKNFATPIGTAGFDDNGDTTNPSLSFFKVAGGKAVFVKTIDAKPQAL